MWPELLFGTERVRPSCLLSYSLAPHPPDVGLSFDVHVAIGGSITERTHRRLQRTWIHHQGGKSYAAVLPPPSPSRFSTPGQCPSAWSSTESSSSPTFSFPTVVDDLRQHEESVSLQRVRIRCALSLLISVTAAVALPALQLRCSLQVFSDRRSGRRLPLGHQHAGRRGEGWRRQAAPRCSELRFEGWGGCACALRSGSACHQTSRKIRAECMASPLFAWRSVVEGLVDIAALVESSSRCSPRLAIALCRLWRPAFASPFVALCSMPTGRLVSHAVQNHPGASLGNLAVVVE